MSYRSFVLLADDGGVDLGASAEAFPSFDPFPDRGPLYADTSLMRECARASAKSLRNFVLPAIQSRAYRGVGRLAVPDHSDSPPDARLLVA